MIDTCPYAPPTAEQVCSYDGLLYFVYEREAIRIARENGLPRERWTKDPVLQRYKFTNIRRRDDRVSQWMLKNVLLPNRKRRDLWFTALVARLINWPPTLERLLYEEVIPCAPEDFDPRAFVRTIESLKGDGRKIYSSAYMLYPTKLEPGTNKAHSVAKYMLGGAVRIAEHLTYSLEERSIEVFVRELSRCYGISTFMAGQVAADLTYCPGQLDRAVDLYSYAPMGPGSLQGLNYLRKRKRYAAWTQEAFNTELEHLNFAIHERLGITDLTLHDMQSVMCEFGKYVRAVTGEANPKNLYNPEKEF